MERKTAVIKRHKNNGNKPNEKLLAKMAIERTTCYIVIKAKESE